MEEKVKQPANDRLQILYQQHLDHLYCDTVIRVKDKEFFVHECIIAAACPKLHDLIQVKDIPMSERYVEINGDFFTPPSFSLLLSFMYIGTIQLEGLEETDVKDLMLAAEWCGFDQIVEKCEKMLDKTSPAPAEPPSEDKVVFGESTDQTVICEMAQDFVESSEEVIQELVIDCYKSNMEEQGPLYCMACAMKFGANERDALIQHMQEHKSGNKKHLKVKLGSPNKRRSFLNARNFDLETAAEEAGEEWEGSGRRMRRKPHLQCSHCEKKFVYQRSKDAHEKKCPSGLEKDDLSAVISYDGNPGHSFGGNPDDSFGGNTCGEGRSESPVRRGPKRKTAQEKMAPFIWKCSMCPDDFVAHRKKDKVLHVRTIHGGKLREDICDFCGKAFLSKGALKLHLRGHTGERPFICSLCGKGFIEHKTLKDHERLHTGERPFLCTKCGKDFTFRQSLYRHMKFHEGKRPFQCSICGKAFVLRQNLKEHVQRHEKHKLVRCIDCFLGFSNNEMLLKHRETCTGSQQLVQVPPAVIDMTVDMKNTVGYQLTLEDALEYETLQT